MQQKTIREWLNELPELYRDIAIYRLDTNPVRKRGANKVESLHDAINRSIAWWLISDSEIEFWLALYKWVKAHHSPPISIHTNENNATSQAILNENKAHFTASTRTVLIAMLKGRTLDKHSGISGNISSRISDLIRENNVPIVKTRKLRSNGKLAYFRYHIAETYRAELIERFKLKI